MRTHGVAATRDSALERQIERYAKGVYKRMRDSIPGCNCTLQFSVRHERAAQKWTSTL